MGPSTDPASVEARLSATRAPHSSPPSTDPVSVEARLHAKARLAPPALHRPCVGGSTTDGYMRTSQLSALHRPCVGGGTTSR